MWSSLRPMAKPWGFSRRFLELLSDVSWVGWELPALLCSSGCHPTGWLPGGGQRRAQYALCHEDLTPGLPCEWGPSHSPGSTGHSSFILVPWEQCQGLWKMGWEEKKLPLFWIPLTLAPFPGRGMSCWLLSLSLSRHNGLRCFRSLGRCKCLPAGHLRGQMSGVG